MRVPNAVRSLFPMITEEGWIANGDLAHTCKHQLSRILIVRQRYDKLFPLRGSSEPIGDQSNVDGLELHSF